MKKQDLEKIGKASPVARMVGTARNEPDAERIQLRKEAGQTRGVKGAKLDRINLSLRPSDSDYIKTMSRASGKTYSEFIHEALEAHKAANMEKYERAKAFIDSF